MVGANKTGDDRATRVKLKANSGSHGKSVHHTENMCILWLHLSISKTIDHIARARQLGTTHSTEKWELNR